MTRPLNHPPAHRLDHEDCLDTVSRACRHEVNGWGFKWAKEPAIPGGAKDDTQRPYDNDNAALTALLRWAWSNLLDTEAAEFRRRVADPTERTRAIGELKGLFLAARRNRRHVRAPLRRDAPADEDEVVTPVTEPSSRFVVRGGEWGAERDLFHFEEIVNSAFVKARTVWPLYRPDASAAGDGLPGWLYTVARNEATDLIKAHLFGAGAEAVPAESETGLPAYSEISMGLEIAVESVRRLDNGTGEVVQCLLCRAAADQPTGARHSRERWLASADEEEIAARVNPAEVGAARKYLARLARGVEDPPLPARYRGPSAVRPGRRTRATAPAADDQLETGDPKEAERAARRALRAMAKAEADWSVTRESLYGAPRRPGGARPRVCSDRRSPVPDRRSRNLPLLRLPHPLTSASERLLVH